MGPLVILGLFAAGALLSGGSGPTYEQVPGRVELADGVTLSPGVGELLYLASQRSGLPIYVTSGDRSARNQAAEMLETVRTEGVQGLSIYRAKDLIRELLGAPRDLNSWTAILQSWADRGVVVSAHMRSGGFDLRFHHYTVPQALRLVSTLRGLGVRVAVERDHIHGEVAA
jgi:hypothetical protein